MELPERFQPQFIEEKQIPIEDILTIKSEDRQSGELWNAAYSLSENFPGPYGIVSFDSIEFRNDNFAINKSDYISIDGDTTNSLYNYNFTQASEVAVMFKELMEELTTGLDYELAFVYDDVNTYTIIGNLELTARDPSTYVDVDITVRFSYNYARLFGLWTKARVINSDGDIELTINTTTDITTLPIIPFISKFKWSTNFGQLTKCLTSSTSEAILSEGNFGGPNQLMIISGAQLKGNIQNSWLVSLNDDKGYPIKIQTNYEIKFRIVIIIKSRWVIQPIPKEYKNLLAPKPVPKSSTAEFRKRVRTRDPQLQARLKIINEAKKLSEAKEKMETTRDRLKTPTKGFGKDLIERVKDSLQKDIDTVDDIIKNIDYDDKALTKTGIRSETSNMLGREIKKFTNKIDRFIENESILEGGDIEKALIDRNLNRSRDEALSTITTNFRKSLESIVGGNDSLKRQIRKLEISNLPLTDELANKLLVGPVESMSLHGGMFGQISGHKLETITRLQGKDTVDRFNRLTNILSKKVNDLPYDIDKIIINDESYRKALAEQIAIDPIKFVNGDSLTVFGHPTTLTLNQLENETLKQAVYGIANQIATKRLKEKLDMEIDESELDDVQKDQEKQANFTIADFMVNQSSSALIKELMYNPLDEINIQYGSNYFASESENLPFKPINKRGSGVRNVNEYIGVESVFKNDYMIDDSISDLKEARKEMNPIMVFGETDIVNIEAIKRAIAEGNTIDDISRDADKYLNAPDQRTVSEEDIAQFL